MIANLFNKLLEKVFRSLMYARYERNNIKNKDIIEQKKLYIAEQAMFRLDPLLAPHGLDSPQIPKSLSEVVNEDDVQRAAFKRYGGLYTQQMVKKQFGKECKTIFFTEQYVNDAINRGITVDPYVTGYLNPYPNIPDPNQYVMIYSFEGDED